jgi:hypothetical protein
MSTEKTEDFHIYLLSDAGESQTVSSQNTASKFIVPINSIKLNPEMDWYAGLKELYIPRTIQMWDNQKTYFIIHGTTVGSEKSITKTIKLNISAVDLRSTITLRNKLGHYLRSDDGKECDYIVLTDDLHFQLTHTTSDVKKYNDRYNWAMLEFDSLLQNSLGLSYNMIPLFNDSHPRYVTVATVSAPGVTPLQIKIPYGMSDYAQEALNLQWYYNMDTKSADETKVYLERLRTMNKIIVQIEKPEVNSDNNFVQIELHQEFYRIMGRSHLYKNNLVYNLKRPHQLHHRKWQQWRKLETNSLGFVLKRRVKLQLAKDRQQLSPPGKSVRFAIEIPHLKTNEYKQLANNNIVTFIHKSKVKLDKRNIGYSQWLKPNLNVHIDDLLDEADRYIDTHSGVLRHITRTNVLDIKIGESESIRDREASNIMVNVPLQNIYYTKMKRKVNSIDEMSIKLLDDEGEQMAFTSGKSALNIHMRPVKKSKKSHEFTISIKCNQDVKLNKHLITSGEKYEVAMTELLLPTTFNNIFENECFISLKRRRTVSNRFRTNIGRYVKPGKYTSESLINALNNIWKDQSLYFYLHPVTSRVVINFWGTNRIPIISINQSLANLLGFYNEVKNHKLTHDLMCNDETVDVFRGFYFIYSYCPRLIEMSYVGNTTNPLFSVDAPDYSRAVNNLEPKLTTYRRVNANLPPLDTLRVDITDSLGRLLQFPVEASLLPEARLHFRTVN